MGLKRQTYAASTDIKLVKDVQKQLRLNLQLWGATQQAGKILEPNLW